MEGNHTIKLYLIAKCFKDAEEQLRRGENAYTSGHVRSMIFNADTEPAHLQGEVQASTKRRVYKVEVYFHLTKGVVSTHCTCPKGQALCHHSAALLFHAHYNINNTNRARQWEPGTSKEEATGETVLTIEELYGHNKFTALTEPISEAKIEEFRNRLGPTNMVGFSWLLRPEVDQSLIDLVPSIDDILFSEEYFKAADKVGYLSQKCSIDSERIKKIAAATVGQHKNEMWYIAKKMRLLASKFGVVLNACQKNEFPPSFFKSLLEGYTLHRALAVQSGKDNEETALKKFIEVTQLDVTPTGMWLHECGFLGTSPDGLIGDDKILEIKCPYRFRNCSIKDGVADRKYFFHYEDEQVVVNTNHIYYHQVQGQLYLTGRQTSYFFVWSPNGHEVLVIEKDPEWVNNINILRNFYLTRFVPAVFDL